MALILNLETATTNCSVSLAEDGVILALQEEDKASYSHAEQLHVFIGQVLERAGADQTALDAVAVSKGPGSYTGLRIGVSAAKGLCFALDIPLISTATLKCLANQAPDREGVRIPMLDARRMEVYAAVYADDGTELRETRAEVITEDSFGDYLGQGKVYLLGSGAGKCRQLLQHTNFRFLEGLQPSAREMAAVSYEKYLAGQFEDTAYFEPYYLKDFLPKGGQGGG